MQHSLWRVVAPATLPYYELLPDHILLILNSAPSETDIAAGIDIYTGRWDEAGLDSWNVARYFTAKKLKLPVEEKYLLTLRERRDTIGTSEALVDIASTYWPNNLDSETLIWPALIQKPTGIRRSSNRMQRGDVPIRMSPAISQRRGLQQTLLLVTQNGANSGHFPDHKVYDLSVQHLDKPGLSELLNERQQLLSSAGFSLMLSDANGKTVDKIGNLDGDPKTMDNPAWKLPSGKTVEGHRSSLIRRYKDGEPLPGTEISGWRPAMDLRLSFITYWGHSTDIGNPGYRKGGYLPVSLSEFNAVFTGTEVVLNWTTESELDNAGFNIYRSESPNGTFTQVNAELIQGAGTTGERQKYEWKDTTAKPNVSYYYRIEDVSFSGVQEQLQTVRMRGQVSASGKQLHTWASLKSDK